MRQCVRFGIPYPTVVARIVSRIAVGVVGAVVHYQMIGAVVRTRHSAACGGRECPKTILQIIRPTSRTNYPSVDVEHRLCGVAPVVRAAAVIVVVSARDRRGIIVHQHVDFVADLYANYVLLTYNYLIDGSILGGIRNGDGRGTDKRGLCHIVVDGGGKGRCAHRHTRHDPCGADGRNGCVPNGVLHRVVDIARCNVEFGGRRALDVDHHIGKRCALYRNWLTRAEKLPVAGDCLSTVGIGWERIGRTHDDGICIAVWIVLAMVVDHGGKSLGNGGAVLHLCPECLLIQIVARERYGLRIAVYACGACGNERRSRGAVAVGLHALTDGHPNEAVGELFRYMILNIAAVDVCRRAG